ncbi:glycosyltransferase [Aeromonas veronii]|uniref:glycosyltransferase family 4 protein n=1 Tax=Aeromonas veronii TaxID=654 RepID=UPI00131667ED|nr:glycosyltransferase family 1 protein [Aeromonas veronii]QHC07526.1 glycosyltransferase [Aeromonas veronii]
MIVYDLAWRGLGGIGRFSESILKRLRLKNDLIEIDLNAHPTSFIYMLKVLFTGLFYHNRSSVFFTPGFIPPIAGYKNFIFTMHDLNHVEIADNSSRLKRLFYNIVVKGKCHKACKILTVSEFSRLNIIEWGNLDPKNVINVGNGVDQGFSTRVAPFLPGYRYLLCVSNRKRHKNEARILLAFSKAMITNDIKLVFSGVISEELKLIIDEYQLAERVVFLGKISEDDLPCVYRGALGLVFPSLYEGFGLPVVEAMACGVPVLTSNTTSLPEVAGDSALLVNPESVDEIRVGIERLVHDETLRTELIAKGLERAKLFSWDAVAARVQAVLDEVTSQYGK